MTSTRSGTSCSTGLLVAYSYDDAGNRTAEGTNDFTYDSRGQLTGCDTGCGTIAYDSAGRTSRWNGWYLTYDGEGRLAGACKVSGCASGDMVTMRYDAAGRRVELVTRPSGGSSTTTTVRYQGEAIAQEWTGTGTPVLTRTYVTDEAGAIVKFCDLDCSGSNPQYLVTWSGHGDALGLWKINTATGALTLANSFTYSTWGQPTVSTHNSFADLGFRFLYVGRYDVQWDNAFGLGLHSMGARHYSPVTGRFLQPDPSALDANLYAYAGNSPVTAVDPAGHNLLRLEGAGGVSAGARMGLGIGAQGALTLIISTFGIGILGAFAAPYGGSATIQQSRAPHRPICIVIGEDMLRRVIPSAIRRTPPCSWLMLEKGMPDGVAMKMNEFWIRSMMKMGVRIYDIGPSLARRLSGRGPSPFYIMEYRVTRGYWNLRKQWGGTFRDVLGLGGQ